MTETLNTARFEKLVGRYSVARDRARWAERRLVRAGEPLASSRLPGRVRAIEHYNGRAVEHQVLATLIEKERREVLQEIQGCQGTMRSCIAKLREGGMPVGVWVRHGDRAVALAPFSEETSEGSYRLVDVPWAEVEQAPPFQSLEVTIGYGRMRDRWERQSKTERLVERFGTLSILGLPAFVLALTGLFTGGVGYLVFAGVLAMLFTAVAVGELFCGPREFLAFTGLPEQVNHGDRAASRPTAIEE